MGTVAMAADRLESGLWEITTTPDFKNIPAPLNQKIDKMCLSKQDIEAGKIDVRMSPDCHVAGGNLVDSHMKLNVSCVMEVPTETEGFLDFAGKSFSGSVNVLAIINNDRASSPHFIYHYQAKWLAKECGELAAKP
jgi:hypothetical protein